MNLLLHKITEAKTVHTLDILGLIVPDRVCLQDLGKGKHLNILECAAIFYTHIHNEQASCLNKNIFHFTRHINEVWDKVGVYKFMTPSIMCCRTNWTSSA